MQHLWISDGLLLKEAAEEDAGRIYLRLLQQKVIEEDKADVDANADRVEGRAEGTAGEVTSMYGANVGLSDPHRRGNAGLEQRGLRGGAEPLSHGSR